MPDESPPCCAIFLHRRVPALRSLLSTSVLQPHSALPSVGRTGWFAVLSPLRQSHHCRQGAANPSTRNEPVAGYAQWSSFRPLRSEEHTSELQSLMRISYAVFCLQKKTTTYDQHISKTLHVSLHNTSNNRE